MSFKGFCISCVTSKVVCPFSKNKTQKWNPEMFMLLLMSEYPDFYSHRKIYNKDFDWQHENEGRCQDEAYKVCRRVEVTELEQLWPRHWPRSNHWPRSSHSARRERSFFIHYKLSVTCIRTRQILVTTSFETSIG